MIRWLAALLVWVAALLTISWYLLPAAANGAYVLSVVVMVATVVPIIKGIVREMEP